MKLLSLVMFCGLAAAPLAVPSVGWADECDNATTQAAMTSCIIKVYQREDAALAQTLKALQAKTAPANQAALTEAQNAWIKYRDLHCKFAAGKNDGGSIYTTVLDACLTEQTKARNAALKSVLELN